jgi:crotonobetainyl-CoA:carnitine CoA-transferase CaiB-like acyl-CoA transferase
MRPLAGVRVLDFSTLLPGPMATLLLAEAGAEVIKVERPGGENMRGYAPQWGDVSATFALLNRGKKSIVADLKDTAARERMRALAAKCDVLVEQFRPGVMDRLGLGYESLRKLNPKLVYCAITGYGQTGPRRDRAGHDLNYIGDAGRHRRRRLSRGDEHAARAAPARCERRRLVHRRVDDGQSVSLHVCGAGAGKRHRCMAEGRRRAADRRVAALSFV